MLEMMMVVTVMMIMTVGTIFVLTSMGNYYKLKTTTMRIKSDIALARQYSLEKNRAYGILFDSRNWYFYSVNDDGSLDTIMVNEIPGQVSLGAKSNDPIDTPIPSSGIQFTSNRVQFTPRRGANPGILYLTNGKDDSAITVNSLGRSKILVYDGENWK